MKWPKLATGTGVIDSSRHIFEMTEKFYQLLMVFAKSDGLAKSGTVPCQSRGPSGGYSGLVTGSNLHGLSCSLSNLKKHQASTPSFGLGIKVKCAIFLGSNDLFLNLFYFLRICFVNVRLFR